MASFGDDNKSGNETKRFLEFSLGGESYAVELLMVKEVITPPEMTPIAQAPSFVCGLMNLRGLVLTVIDLRKKLGIKPSLNTSENGVIILELEDNRIGVVVDSIQKVLSITSDYIKPSPDEQDSSSVTLLGVLQNEDRLTMWLDPQYLFQSSHSFKKAS